MTTPFTDNIAREDGPWTALKGAALPMAKLLIWPAHPVGNWKDNGISASAYQRVFDHFVDSGEMLDTVTCPTGNGYGTTWIPTHGWWLSLVGISLAEHAAKNAAYISQGYQEVSVSTCGTIAAAIWRKP